MLYAFGLRLIKFLIAPLPFSGNNIYINNTKQYSYKYHKEVFRLKSFNG
jgi:hypothetical protein